MTSPDPGAGPAPSFAPWPHQCPPLLPVVLAFCIAIVAAEWSADHFVWAVSAIVSLVGCAVGLALCSRRARGLLLTTACMLALGYAYTMWRAVVLPPDHISHYLSPTPVTLEGRVLRLVKVGPNRTMLDLSA